MTRRYIPLVSNAGVVPLTVWIEPWCDELSLPARSTLACSSMDGDGLKSPPELEINDQGTLVVWTTTAGTLSFDTDGMKQDTGSRIIPLPDELMKMPIKHFVTTAFGGHPEARAGGLIKDRSDGRVLSGFMAWLRSLLRKR